MKLSEYKPMLDILTIANFELSVGIGSGETSGFVGTPFHISVIRN